MRDIREILHEMRSDFLGRQIYLSLSLRVHPFTSLASSNPSVNSSCCEIYISLTSTVS